jgi:hypothetical protein
MTDYITTQQLADLLKIKPNTLEIWRCHKDCPIPFIRVKRRVLYAMADVMAYLESQKCNPPATG